MHRSRFDVFNLFIMQPRQEYTDHNMSWLRMLVLFLEMKYTFKSNASSSVSLAINNLVNNSNFESRSNKHFQ